jgi:acyl CoA:acetate/3-ketoacid CoA transferase
MIAIVITTCRIDTQGNISPKRVACNNGAGGFKKGTSNANLTSFNRKES